MFLLAWSRGRWWTVAPSTLWLERWFSILCYACGAVAYSFIRRVVGNAPFCSAFGTVTKASVRETINTTYFSGRTYTAVKSLYTVARKKKPAETLQDVSRWIAKNTVRMKSDQFQNSWVPKGPREEYQIDMFGYNHKQSEKLRV